jgi:membrane associated rhomboid family serine protease
VAQVVQLLTTRPWALLVWAALGMCLGTVLRALLGQSASRLAIVPRTAGGLFGIVTAPFIHGGFAHLVANLPPFLVLGALVLRHGEHTFVRVALLVVFASGLLVWLFARSAAHLGASGVVFGFFGYLVAFAYFHHTITDGVIAVIVILVYGSMLAGIKPARNGTSFEAHFFGLLAGIGVAWLDRAF